MIQIAALVARIAGALAALIMVVGTTHAEGPTRRFVHISDIHFDPFDPPELARLLAASAPEQWSSIFAGSRTRVMSNFGKDTNHALLVSALQAVAGVAKEADFAIVTGDFLAHRFEEQTAEALGVPELSGRAKAFAASTTIFVADALGDRLPGKPVIMSL